MRAAALLRRENGADRNDRFRRGGQADTRVHKADLAKRAAKPRAEPAYTADKAQLDGESAAHGGITGGDMYMLGLSGTGSAAEKRARLAAELGLPDGLSAHAMLDVLNSMYTPDSLAEVCGGIFAEREDENGAV